jgi:dinuclear metal center YbgI/SA1388 family protein
MIVQQIITVLEEVAPLYLQENYDNAGLLTGNTNWECTGAIIGLDVNEEVVLEAIEKKCNLIIVHHPIIFKGLKKLTGNNYVENCIISAIKNNIAIYAIHTNLDNVLDGVNGKIANEIGLINCQVLLPKNEDLPVDSTNYQIGSGLLGELPNSLSEIDFLKSLKEKFNLSVIKHTKLLGKPVYKVALCGGAGSFLIQAAIAAGADFYISSDIKYHEFFDANQRLVIADIGHYESEQFTSDLIFDILREKFPTFAALKTGVSTNPVHYYL